MSYHGPPDQLGFYKKTVQRMDIIKKYISTNLRFPPRKEVKEWFGISNTAASELLYRVREKMEIETETWEEIQNKVLENVLEMVEDKEKPLDRALLIKLLQFIKPIKKDVQEIVGGVEVVHRLVIEKPDELLGQEEESPPE